MTELNGYEGVRLSGLDGRTPAGFLAALGVLAGLEMVGQAEGVRLAFPQPEGVAVLSGLPQSAGLTALGERLAEVCGLFSVSPAFPEGGHKYGVISADGRDEYLTAADWNGIDSGRWRGAYCPVSAPAVIDSQPSGAYEPKNPFVFTTGQQDFFSCARYVLAAADDDPGSVLEAIRGPWTYGHFPKAAAKNTTCRWDSISRKDPGRTGGGASRAGTNPGVEALAVMGLRWFRPGVRQVGLFRDVRWVGWSGVDRFRLRGGKVEGCASPEGEAGLRVFRFPLWDRPVGVDGLSAMLSRWQSAGGLSVWAEVDVTKLGRGMNEVRNWGRPRLRQVG